MARTRKAAALAAASVETVIAGVSENAPLATVVAADAGEGAVAALIDRRGVVRDIPLDRLKKSPRNARKQPHSLEAIQALAGSIAAKTMLHPPTVEPELDAAGEPTGDYLVTIGEGRRLAMVLLAQRGAARRDEPVRCVVSTAHDPFELSLDENVTREDMHPADQYEAFKRLADERGWSAQEIAARFGVSEGVVRRRMKLGAVSPKLIDLYREGALSLDQLMAFAISDDPERQEQVHAGLNAYNRAPYDIRRALTEAKVHAGDRRAVFVGVEDYLLAGGTLLRDLFTEDGGGWFEDVALLDRLAAEKLEAAGAEVKAEGWKWVESYMAFPHAHGLPRLYPQPVRRAEDEVAAHNAMAEEYDRLTEQWADVEDLPAEVEARLAEIDAALQAWGDGTAYDPADVARCGAFVVLGHDGLVRVERGFLRPEDALAPARDGDEDDGGLGGDVSGQAGEGGGHGAADPDDVADRGEGAEPEADEPEGLSPLPDRLVADLTAHRTLALREAVAGSPDVALLALTHAMVAKTFYPYAGLGGCLDVRVASIALAEHAEGIMDTPLARAAAERHALWATQLPGLDGLWPFIVALDADSRASLLAHCVAQTLDAVALAWVRKPGVLAHADALATMLGLDMTASWSASVDSYLGRVTKAHILEAVRDGVSEAAATRMADLKKPAMAQAAAAALAGAGWLPPVLRTRAQVQAKAEDRMAAG
ncbi:MAG: ParB/RepB/Spo0J family partition protein [Proteobacteria bacterium]|nr:ParB/RepB/Spo0J family partition protein [Pseudomonadota bacterium]